MQPDDPKPSLTAFDTKSPSAQLNERLSHPYDEAQFRKTHRLDLSDGIVLENPTDRTVWCICHLHTPKPPPRASGKPDDDDDDDEPDVRRVAAARAAQTASAVKITFAPGERKWIPSMLVSALVTLRDGAVVAGQMHMLRVPGEVLPMHPSLIEADGEAAPFAMPRRNQSVTLLQDRAVVAPEDRLVNIDGGIGDEPKQRKRAP